MEIRLRSNGQTMLEAEFRAYQAANGGPTWGLTTEEILDSLDADVVFEGAPATTTDIYQTSQRQGVEQIDGKWYTKYVVGPVFTKYTNENGVTVTVAQQKAAYKTMIDDQVKASNKQKASDLLSETDWTVLPDVTNLTNKEDFVTYRAALRAIAVNPTVDVVFPVKPDTVWA